MIPNDARKAIYARFLDNFSLLDRDRINFDNEKFAEPMSGEWVRLVVRHQVRIQITLGKNGNRKFRYTGVVFAQIFTEADTKTLTSDTIAKSISDIFDAVSFEGLDFQASASRESGPGGKWNMVIVEAPFTYEERK